MSESNNVTEYIENTVKERVEKICRPLRAEIVDLKERLLIAEHEKAISQWAVKGVAAHCITLRVSPMELVSANLDISEMMRIFADRAAHQLIQVARLNFDKWAELNKMKMSVRYDYLGNREQGTPPSKEFWPGRGTGNG